MVGEYLIRLLIFILLQCLGLCVHASIDLDSAYPDLDEQFIGKVHFTYGAFNNANGKKTDTFLGRVTNAVWDAPNFSLVSNTKISDNIYFRGSAEAVILDSQSNNITPTIQSYGVDIILSKFGVVSLGLLPGPTRQMLSFTELESGVRAYAFEDVADIEAIDRHTNASLGYYRDGAHFGPVGGTGYRPMLRYMLPLTSFELMVALGGDQVSITEGSIKYIYDGSFARWVSMLGFASDMPDQATTHVIGVTGPAYPTYKGYRYIENAGKLSVGFVDWIYSYSWLNTKQNKPSASHWFTGLDYTFLDFSTYGPLTLGVGFFQQKHGSLDLKPFPVATSAAIPVVDVKSKGWIFALNKKFGNAGIRTFFERFSTQSSKSANPTKFHSKPIYALGITMYYDFISRVSQDG